MKIHREFEQGSIDWFQARAGKVTASEMSNLVTPLAKVKTGDGPKTYLIEKLAEVWTGSPIDGFSSWSTEQGQFLEEAARPAFTLETGLDVEQVGFIESDDGKAGCSPDGILTGKEIGLEIKCPGVVNHIRYLIDGKLPVDYVAQVQASIFITGFSKWMFFSFRRKMPPLVLTVERDEAYQQAISDALCEFSERFDANMKRLCEINGGPPKRITVPKKQPSPEPGFDVMP
jgi:hypothetical protein